MKPPRLKNRTTSEDAFSLTLLLVIGISGFFVEGARIALGTAQGHNMDFERFSIVGYPVAKVFSAFSNPSASTLSGAHRWLWVGHVAAFILFLLVLASTKLRHMATSPLNSFVQVSNEPRGAMSFPGNLLDDDVASDVETIGVRAIEDFTWQGLLDTDACTMCGRCVEVCPAAKTGKPLAPRTIVLKVGDVMAATAGGSGGDEVVAPDARVEVNSDSVFELVTPEEVWACTTCVACDEACPVDIKILDKILDMRRNLTLMESDFPSALGTTFRNMENNSNPWGLSQSARMDWAKGLEVPVVEPGGKDDAEFDYDVLYWVGCAGAFDDSGKRVSRAMVKIFEAAGVSFAVLGPNETCTGDSARRAGNEYLYQQMATENIAKLDSLRPPKIVTQCPHCFNTIANEYPQLGGNFEVVHHSTFIAELIAKGSLEPGHFDAPHTLTYHDSCYLGRHNDVYEAPRNAIESIGNTTLVEMTDSKNKGMCCGAGGAHFWFEDDTGERINAKRAAQASQTGADIVATACPFCAVMLDDGTKDNKDTTEVVDIAILIERTLNA